MSAAAMPVLREVRLYGHLRARFGRSHWLAVNSPAEALRALGVLFKGFREAMQGHNGPGYRVLVGDGSKAHARDENSLNLGAGSATVIRIAPVIHGRKRGGVLQTIIGVVLIVAGAYFKNPDLVKMGVMMVLGGVIQMLSKQPGGSGSKAGLELSKSIGGPVNVLSEGGPVPLIIGRMIVGSVVVSAGLATDDYTPPATTPPAAPTLPGDEPPSWIGYGDGA